MVKMYYDTDADLSLLQDKRIAVIGYGSQGHAHALNLRDSGCSIIVGLPTASKSRQRALSDDWQPVLPADAAKEADIIMLLVPDQHQGQVYEQDVRPHLSAGKMLMVAHGFGLHYKQVNPPQNIDVSMVVPTAPGPIL